MTYEIPIIIVIVHRHRPSHHHHHPHLYSPKLLFPIIISVYNHVDWTVPWVFTVDSTIYRHFFFSWTTPFLLDLPTWSHDFPMKLYIFQYFPEIFREFSHLKCWVSSPTTLEVPWNSRRWHNASLHASLEEQQPQGDALPTYQAEGLGDEDLASRKQ
jgi:hypothetical protein